MIQHFISLYSITQIGIIANTDTALGYFRVEENKFELADRVTVFAKVMLLMVRYLFEQMYNVKNSGNS